MKNVRQITETNLPYFFLWMKILYFLSPLTRTQTNSLNNAGWAQKNTWNLWSSAIHFNFIYLLNRRDKIHSKKIYRTHVETQWRFDLNMDNGTRALAADSRSLCLVMKLWYWIKEEIVDHHEKSSFCYPKVHWALLEQFRKRILVGDEQGILNKFTLLECKWRLRGLENIRENVWSMWFE